MIEIISKTEVWVPVVGYIGLYEVSSFGRIKTFNFAGHNGVTKILNPFKNKKGYLQIRLFKNKIGKCYMVHRLVATAFLPNWFNEPQVNHRDENKQNNHVDNLEWCDNRYNINYGTAIKRSSEKKINGKCSKKVLQYDLEGNFIAEYPSLHEISRLYGYSFSDIAACCRGYRSKSVYGFVWKYKD